MSAQTGQNRLGPSVRARIGRTQAATWAWAGKVPRRACARLGRRRPDQSRPSAPIRWPSVDFGRYKNPPTPASSETLAHFLRRSLSSFSLCRRSFLSAAQDREDSEREQARRARRWSVHGAVAGPLAGARAPQRVSTPPSSGLAAAPPWPSPASQLPRLGFFSRAGEGTSRRTAR